MHRIPHRSSLIRNVVLSLAAAAALTGPAMAQTTDAPATEAPAETPAPAPAPAQAEPAPAQPQTQAAPAQPEAPRQVVVATHGDWNIVCLNGDKPCIMRQIGKSADGREVMDVSIRRIAAQ